MTLETPEQSQEVQKLKTALSSKELSVDELNKIAKALNEPTYIDLIKKTIQEDDAKKITDTLNKKTPLSE